MQHGKQIGHPYPVRFQLGAVNVEINVRRIGGINAEGIGKRRIGIQLVKELLQFFKHLV